MRPLLPQPPPRRRSGSTRPSPVRARDLSSSANAQDSSGRSIEDWELWADPREIGRRRAERAAARLPPEVRRGQVATEYARAKDYAAQAKSSGDKGRQKEAGALIRELKAEMCRLGLTEDEAARLAGGGGPPPPPPHAPTAAPRPAPPATPAPRAVADDWEAAADGGDGGFAFDLFCGGEPSAAGNAPASAAASSSGAPGASSSAAPATDGDGGAGGDDGSAWGMLDLFSDEAALASLETIESKKKAAAPEGELQPWGFEGEEEREARRAARQRKKAAPPPSAEAQRMPKALLQQHCLKMGWAQPRFDKLPGVGGEDGGLRCAAFCPPCRLARSRACGAAAHPSPCPSPDSTLCSANRTP
jgi:hypothetical protein